jgi:hypothetical protein
MCYNLSLRRMEEIIVTDKHSVENFCYFTLEESKANMGDRGYGTGKNFAHTVSLFKKR